MGQGCMTINTDLYNCSIHTWEQGHPHIRHSSCNLSDAPVQTQLRAHLAQPTAGAAAWGRKGRVKSDAD